MTGPGDDFKYDVAISFLGNDLDVAQKLADLLRDRMNVFLFTERQSEIAGADGIELLSAVFGGEARIAVILYRQGWGQTPWTRIEETAIKNRGLEKGWDFLLTIPLEANPSLPKWIPRAQIWLSYERYGLGTAVAIVERKLEETGGEPKPVTATTRAREFARRAEWQAERELRLRSQDSVDTAKVQVQELFAKLAKAVSEVTSGSRSDIQFKQPQQNAARIWSHAPKGEGTTVTIYWSQQWANVLAHSALRVRLFEGFASAAGENIVAFEEPRELQEHDFDFEYAESGRWVWQHRDTGKQYDTEELAAFCIGLLIDRMTS